MADVLGFLVEEARHAAEAVEKARIRLPDLIVMDLAVPVLRGRQAMHLLASDPATAAVPIWPAVRRRMPCYPTPRTGPRAFSRNRPTLTISWCRFATRSDIVRARLRAARPFSVLLFDHTAL